MTKEIVNYEVYTSLFMLAGSTLYSGGEYDPLVQAKMDAEDRLAYDSNGNKLWYSLSVSIFGQEWERDIALFEEKDIRYRRWDQKLAVHVIVFYTMDDWMKYELGDRVIIDK